ncbi:MAG: hypothetical protein SVO01_00625 [Thermotogota bacterium]|nr:hypothetical protein [Thermotogota bacterium]
MSNPTVNFRISKFQLARGLQIIRQLEPNYQLTSISKLVKTIYTDYIAKMTLGKSDAVPQHYLDEIESLLNTPRGKIPSFMEFTKDIPIKIKEEKSIKSSVEDFSPPENWGE